MSDKKILQSLFRATAKENGPKSFVETVSAAQSSKDVALAAERGFNIGMEKARLLWHVL